MSAIEFTRKKICPQCNSPMRIRINGRTVYKCAQGCDYMYESDIDPIEPGHTRILET